MYCSPRLVIPAGRAPEYRAPVRQGKGAVDLFRFPPRLPEEERTGQCLPNWQLINFVLQYNFEIGSGLTSLSMLMCR